MQLDKIEIKGFKSFKEKTEISFPGKFTTIVGPNGSGKSNITEAVCFVLGRSRGLRAQNLQELIFNGGKNDPPAKKAVVSIRVKEEDGTPHSISRMVDVEGHSMYKIDGKRLTRQHVLDMVGDNEYNIILQDDVTKVIDMKPKERRQVIDELCGIAEYDKKRDKALKELSKVEDRISETHIVLGEKQGYLNKLKRERDDALRYKEVKGELEQNQASILNHDILLYKNRLERYDEQISEAEKEREGVQERINRTSGEIESKRAQLKDINNRIIDLEDGRSKSRYAQLKEEIARKESLIQTLKEKIEEGGSEADSNKKRIEESKVDEGRAESRLKEIEGELKSLESEISDESKKAGDPHLEDKIDDLKESVFKARSQIEGLDDSIQSLSEKKESLVGVRAELEGKLKNASEDLQTAQKTLDESRETFDEKASAKNKLSEELNSIELNLAKIQNELEQTQLKHAKKKTELTTIEESWGGIHGAEKAVMRLKDVISGIHGPLSQLGEVEDQEYETALSIAVGGRMHWIVIDNVEVAAKCIDYLRKKEIGRSTFIPLNRIKANLGKKLPKEAIGFARDYIKCDKKFEPVFEYVLGDTIIVDDINTAQDIGVGEYRMVTLDGSLLELSGALTGGFIKKGVEVGFNNLEDMEADIGRLESEIEAKTAERDTLTERKDGVKKNLILIEEDVFSLQSKVEEANLVFERNNQITGTLENEIKRVSEETESIEKEVKVRGESKDRISDELEKNSRQLEPLTAEKKKHDTIHLDELKDRRRDLEVEASGLREKLRGLDERCKELSGEIKTYGISEQKWRESIESTNIELDELKSELSVVERESSTLMGEIKSLVNKRSDIEDSIQNRGAQIGELNHDVNTVNERISSVQISRAKVEAELETLDREFAKFEAVELVERKVGEMRGMIERLSKKLEDFGAINMKAIETYDSIKSEYDDIIEKLETLKSERQSIFDFMEEVERKKHDTFMKTFTVVKENFEQIFHKLSDGEGTLILNNPKEISESGLLIKASPGGKKIMSLDAMSGGEKVLTSASFLLAIQQYKPAFFYIVDELDAALDKSNSARLAEMLRESNTQFIMVTHNNAMIQYAETVVGVSMTEGVSRIVGVKLES